MSNQGTEPTNELKKIFKYRLWQVKYFVKKLYKMIDLKNIYLSRWYSWIHDEKFGWTLIEEDFETPVFDAPVVFYDQPKDLIPENATKLKVNDYIL